MPIVVVGSTPPPVVIPEGVRVVERLTPSVTLTDSTGAAITLGGEGTYTLQPGAQGLGLAPVALFTDALPDDDGSLFRAVRLTEKDIFLPVLLLTDGYQSLRDARRDLERLVDPKRGPVSVTVGQPDGEQRTAQGWYTGGMEGSYGKDVFGVEWQLLGLTFRAVDPYWYGDPVVLTFKLPSAVKPFLSSTEAFFPVVLGASQVLGTVQIDNPGDSDTFPQWLVEGPGDSFVATNEATGKSFTFGDPIDVGDSILVDTRRSVQTVEDQSGTNLWASLDVGSALWPLVPGVQTVTLTMASATSASQVTVTFTPRYRSAV